MTEVPSRRPSGTPCWVSLMAHNLAAAQDFYGALFGWEFHPGPEHLGPYVRAELGGRQVAGIGDGPKDRHLPVSWTTLAGLRRRGRTAELIRECGGTVGVGPLDADNGGRMAVAVDPSGAVFGIWQASATPEAEVTANRAPRSWNELLTRESVDRREVLHRCLRVRDGDPGGRGLRLLTLRLKGRAVAAIQGVGAVAPPRPGRALDDVLRRGGHWTPRPAGWSSWAAKCSQPAATGRRAGGRGGGPRGRRLHRRPGRGPLDQTVGGPAAGRPAARRVTGWRPERPRPSSGAGGDGGTAPRNPPRSPAG